MSALRAALKQQGVKVSVNDCVIKAAALALAEVPAANALWDAAAEAPKAAGGVDIAVAVATDTGLITPIIRGADAKPLPQIAAEVRELAGRARAGRLRPEEFQGGSFSISNLGMFGVDEFSAIINPPQVGVSMGRCSRQRVWQAGQAGQRKWGGAGRVGSKRAKLRGPGSSSGSGIRFSLCCSRQRGTAACTSQLPARSSCSRSGASQCWCCRSLLASTGPQPASLPPSCRPASWRLAAPDRWRT